MSLSLEDFKQNIADLARPNRFKVSFSGEIVSKVGITDGHSYLVKAASIPGRSVGDLEFHWFGRAYHIAGDPSYEDMEITFLNDYEFDLRGSIEAWMDYVVDSNTNEHGSHMDYKAEIKITQIGRTSEDILAEYVLKGCHPKDIRSIDLSMENSDQIEEFSVTFSNHGWKDAE